MTTITVAEAKASFAECLRAAEGGEPVVVTRHGKPVAALVPLADLETLQRLQAAGPAGGLASLAGGWKDSEELAASAPRVRRSRRRAKVWLDWPVAYLFDTDAISELLRSRPLAAYLDWLRAVPRVEQYTSAVVIGELYRGAYRSQHRDRHRKNIEERVLPAITVLPYDTGVARVWGEIQAALETAGTVLADADGQIAATAIRHDLELVTGNRRHFERVPGLRLCRALADARLRRGW
jgi:prevent-host-death family protein